MKKKKVKNAYITHSVTDQGNGGASCSNCHYSLDEYLERRTKKIQQKLNEAVKRAKNKCKSKKRTISADPGKLKCPKCGARLEDGGVYISMGGSDF